MDQSDNKPTTGSLPMDSPMCHPNLGLCQKLLLVSEKPNLLKSYEHHIQKNSITFPFYALSAGMINFPLYKKKFQEFNEQSEDKSKSVVSSRYVIVLYVTLVVKLLKLFWNKEEIKMDVSGMGVKPFYPTKILPLEHMGLKIWY